MIYIYLAGMCDSLLVVSAFLIVIACGFFLMGGLAFIDDHKKECVELTKRGLITFVISLLMVIFIPTTRTVYIMLGVNELGGIENIKELPVESITALLNLTKEYNSTKEADNE